jgi:hypothetical protein
MLLKEGGVLSRFLRRFRLLLPGTSISCGTFLILMLAVLYSIRKITGKHDRQNCLKKEAVFGGAEGKDYRNNRRRTLPRHGRAE